MSSCHPQIPAWCGTKPRLLIMNRVDMVSHQDQLDWKNHYGRQGVHVYNTDANQGKGIRCDGMAEVQFAKQCVLLLAVSWLCCYKTQSS